MNRFFKILVIGLLVLTGVFFIYRYSNLEASTNSNVIPVFSYLEYIQGEIYANIWQTERIARIDPLTGEVIGWIDLKGILSPKDNSETVDVLNGIAYDAKNDRLFVTGKFWPKLFEIELIRSLFLTLE